VDKQTNKHTNVAENLAHTQLSLASVKLIYN